MDQVISSGSGAFDLFGQNAVAVAIACGEVDDGGEDEQRHQTRHDEQEDEQRIDVARHGRGPFRPQWKIIEHIALAESLLVLMRVSRDPRPYAGRFAPAEQDEEQRGQNHNGERQLRAAKCC